MKTLKGSRCPLKIKLFADENNKNNKNKGNELGATR